ncbi:MAG: GldG family protein [Candidatus Omnitrophota bacterium]
MKFLRKIAPLFSLLGILLILAGLSIAYVKVDLNDMAKGFVMAGASIFVLSLFFFNLRKLIRSLRLSKNIPVVIFISGLLVILVGANFLAKAYNRRFDLTAQKYHTLSDATASVLKGLKHDVKITAFHVGLAPKYIEDLFAEYEKMSAGRVDTEIVDPLEQLGYAAQFGNVITGDEKKVIVQCEREKATIDFKEEPLSEELLTNAILEVARDKRSIYFLIGHGEYDVDNKDAKGLSTLKKLLETNNCQIQTLFLGDGKAAPKDCDILIIAGPQNPFGQKEEKSIQDYLKKGGKALILIESKPIGTPENPLNAMERLKNPALNSLLNPWGLEIGNDIVVDLENHAGEDAGSPATRNYPPHKDIIQGLDYTFYVRPRSISLAKELSKTIKIAPLVLTASTKNSWAETSESLEIKFDEGKDLPGPVVLSAVVLEPKNEKKESDTRIIVFTDADFVSNAFIDQYSNAQIFLNSVGWLSKLINLVKIGNRKIDVPRLDLTSQQKRIVIVILFGVPIATALLGCFVWWKRSLSG